jgi:hypothetical protein
MEQKDYKKILRKIQLSANMFIDTNGFAGWVYSMIATELDENAHWNFMSTEVLEKFNEEIANELQRRRGDEKDKKKEEPTQQLTVKTRKSLKGATIYPPAPAVMEMVTKRVAEELEGFSDAFKVRDNKIKQAAYEPDDGPLTTKEIRAIRKEGKKQIKELGIDKGKVRSSLFSAKKKAKKKVAKKAKK